MQIEKRFIWFQLLMFIIFLILPVSYIVKVLIDSKITGYFTIGIFLVLIGLLILIFKKSKQVAIPITKNQININKYNMYVFIIGYVFLVIINKETVLNLKSYVLLAILFSSTIFGIIFNSIILIKNRIK